MPATNSATLPTTEASEEDLGDQPLVGVKSQDLLKVNHEENYNPAFNTYIIARLRPETD